MDVVELALLTICVIAISVYLTYIAYNMLNSASSPSLLTYCIDSALSDIGSIKSVLVEIRSSVTECPLSEHIDCLCAEDRKVLCRPNVKFILYPSSIPPGLHMVRCVAYANCTVDNGRVTCRYIVYVTLNETLTIRKLG